MDIASALRQTRDRLKQIPKKYYVFGLFGVVAVLYVAFFWPKSVTLSYSQATCVRELTLLPGIQRTVDNAKFEVELEGVRSIGSWPVFATSSCITPVEAPHSGQDSVALAPWGGLIGRQQFNIDIPEEPKVNAAAFAEAIPTTRPLEVKLDRPDTLHLYKLAVGDKTTECQADGLELACDIEQLELKQAASYDFEMQRQFAGSQPQTVSSGKLMTLKAVKITKASVKSGQTIYSKPRKFTLTTDKPIESATAALKSGKDTIATEVAFKGKTITVTVKKDLPREKEFQLIVDKVEATDASTLSDPYKLKFKLSGGPKVAGISIGSSKVDPNAQVVITFDQDISDRQNVASLVSFKGGQATATKIGPRQIAVQLSGLGRCVPFTISVAGGMLSKYDIKNGSGWSHSGRTICYTTSVYGTSLQGRPLVSYHFGNSGPVTLYTGAIHGNEVSSMYMMQSWIAELEANPSKIGNRQIVVIPNVNPDGVAAGTRNNSRDVNLSRNFPTDNWVKDIDDTDGPNKGGGGKKPLSEPEAAALARLTQNLRPRLLLSYHAVGSLVVGDGHGTYSGGKAAQYASMVGYRNATGDGGTFDYSITGAYEDWTWRNIGIPSIVIELGSYSFHDFGWHRAAMWAMLNQ